MDAEGRKATGQSREQTPGMSHIDDAYRQRVRALLDDERVEIESVTSAQWPDDRQVTVILSVPNDLWPDDA